MGRTSIYLNDWEDAVIRDAARSLGVPTSRLMKEAVMFYLEHKEGLDENIRREVLQKRARDRSKLVMQRAMYAYNLGRKVQQLERDMQRIKRVLGADFYLRQWRELEQALTEEAEANGMTKEEASHIITLSRGGAI